MNVRFFRFCILLSLLLTVSILSGCTSRANKAETPGEKQKESSDISTSEHIEGNTDIVSSYTLDRNNADLSSFDLPIHIDGNGVIYSLFLAKPIMEDEFDSPAGQDEVRLYQVDYDNVYRKESNKYAFSFRLLPAYDEKLENSYTLQGSRIRFLFHTMDNSFGLGCIEGRCVTDAFDHAFILQTVAQANYVPYQHPISGADQESIVPHRLVICIDNDNGIRDTFLIGQDLHILHFEGDYPTDEYITQGMIEDISVEAVPSQWFLYLEAMAARYVYGYNRGSSDVLNITRYFADLEQDLPEDVIAKAYAGAELRLEYEGNAVCVENPEDFAALIRLLEPDVLAVQYPDFLWSSEAGTSYREDAIHVILTDKTEEVRGTLAELYLSPDGTIWIPTEKLYVSTNADLESSYLFFRSRFVYRSLDQYPFEEIAAFVK